ncbi:MAG: DNA mismatch repair endonuclease MutL [Bacteroidota bacterium]
MLDIIHLLPDSIANQIAAGEVVQRPASAVKELLENAIDAGATSIQLIVKEAGKSLIQVIDNGVGMSETDARMCFERHATSKIKKSEDLFTLKTMGFRGEAMASIAAIAQVEMRTRRPTDELGFLLKIEGSSLKAHEAVQTPIGTNVQVKNLFYNVPARRNFLKSNPVEMKHIIDEFQRVALANPSVSFSMYNAEEEVYNLPAGRLSKRIIDLFGKNYQQQLAPCKEETDFLNVTGYIGKPDFAKKTKTEQFFFANGRFIKSGYLHHAVMTAFAGMLEEGSHPFYVLFLEIDPARIDINVHPTKTEIKFDDERSVYAVVSAACRKAMNQYNLNPSIDFESDMNVDFLAPVSRQSVEHKYSELNRNIETNSLQKANLGNWQKLYEGFEPKAFERNPSINQEDIVFKSKANPVVEFEGETFKSNIKSGAHSAHNIVPESTNAIQIHNQFILAQVKSGLLLIDQKKAYERIIYEQYESILLKNQKASSQQLLFPISVQLNPADMLLVTDMEEEIINLGFTFNAIGANSLIIYGIPSDILDESAQEIFESLIEQFKQNKTELSIDKKENLARAFSKRLAFRQNKTLQMAEIHLLVDQLFASKNPQFTPGGEAIMRIVSLEKLEGILTNK